MEGYKKKTDVRCVINKQLFDLWHIVFDVTPGV